MHKAKDLSLVSEKDLGLAAVCQHCEAAEPEEELLMCEHFSTSCLGCAHLGCLSPPLKKVPKGPWLCQLCGGGAAQAKTKANSENSRLAVQDSAPSGKEQTKPKTKAKVDAVQPPSKNGKATLPA